MTIKRLKIGSMFVVLTLGLIFLANVPAAAFAGASGGPIVRKVLKALVNVNLDQEQKAEIAKILQRDRNLLRTGTDSLNDAQMAFYDAVRQDGPTDEQIRNAFRKMNAIHENVILDRIHTLRDIKQVLRPEQREVVEKLGDELPEDRRQQRDAKRNLVDSWLESNGVMGQQ